MAWDVVSKDTNSLLASADVNQLQLNFSALAAQNSGAPTLSPTSMTILGVGSFATINVASNFTSALAIIGNDTSVSGTTNPKLEVVGGNLSAFGGGFYEFSNTTGRAPEFELAHSNTNTIGSQAALSDTSLLGSFILKGSDGIDFRRGASIISTIDGSVSSGNLPSDLRISTNGGSSTDTERFRITPSGQLSSGAESAPDVDPGGICINHGSNDGNVLTLKNSDVNHGVTDLDETDTYAAFGKYDNSNGGFRVRGYGELEVGLNLQAIATTEDNTDTTGSSASTRVRARKKSGISTTTFTDSANIFMSSNDTLTRFLIKGNGDLYATNTTITALDDHDDIALARNLQLTLGGDKYKHDVSKEDFEQLVKLQAISSTGDFQIVQGCTAVTLGAIGQLFNIFKGLAKKLEIDESELLEMAKQY